MECEQELKLDTPFRGQPALSQVGGALIVAGLLLFAMVLPIHLVTLLVLDPANPNNFPLWKLLLPLLILGGFLALGSWMAHKVIRGAYEIARPARILLAVAIGSAALQVVIGLFGYGLTLLLIEVAGIFACLVAGFILAKAGQEVAAIVNRHSAGGGLGSLAGLVLGYLCWDSPLKMIGCVVGGGLLAEGLGRLIRFAIDRRQNGTTTGRAAGCSRTSR